MFKDQVYLYTIKHRRGALIALILSITFPPALSDLGINHAEYPALGLEESEIPRQNFIHNMMIFYGFTDGSDFENAM